MGKPQVMKTNLDKYGRIVIPKPVRAQLGITMETPLALIADENRIIIEPIPEEPPLEDRDGVLVYTGTCHAELNRYLQTLREERLDILTDREAP